jgi:hypothetical protein
MLAFDSLDKMGEMTKEAIRRNIKPFEVYREICEREEDYESAQIITNILDQERYNAYCSEIFEKNNLSESDRIAFYELHNKVAAPDAAAIDKLVFELRRQKVGNDHYILSPKEREHIFHFLENKRLNGGLNRHEYNYLAFLIFRHGFSSTATIPCVPKVIPIDLLKFEQKFKTSGRIELLKTFKTALGKCRELYKVESFSIVIGGSFLDLKNESPCDIDAIILLPLNAFRTDYSNKILNTIINGFKDDNGTKLFDLLKLPDSYDSNLYMAYEQLTLLGNKPNDKLEKEIIDMIYHCRDIYQINILPDTKL